MSDLTDDIARKHRMTLVDQNAGTTKCACGTWTPSLASEGMLDVQGRHVAEVTEAAVREWVAAEIESYTDAVLDLVDTQNGARLAFIEVARIAREGRP